jgi:hypothetical protein
VQSLSAASKANKGKPWSKLGSIEGTPGRVVAVDAFVVGMVSLDRGPVQRNYVSHAIYVMEAGESQVFVLIKMKKRARIVQVSRNM